MTVAGVFLQLVRHPADLLVRRWNWKSAELVILGPVTLWRICARVLVASRMMGAFISSMPADSAND
jgi:hypothetical protein